MRALFYHQLSSSIFIYPDLLSLAMGRLTTWRLTPPDLILLNTEMAPLWLRPVSICPSNETTTLLISMFKSNTKIIGSDRSSKNAIPYPSIYVAQVFKSTGLRLS